MGQLTNLPKDQARKYAMAAWRSRQRDNMRQPKVMRCNYCGGGAYEGEKCKGCGSTQFLTFIEMPKP